MTIHLRLTKVQRQQYEDLKENKTLYIGYNCPSIMRTFDSLVNKGLAIVIEVKPGNGKKYQVKEN